MTGEELRAALGPTLREERNQIGMTQYGLAEAAIGGVGLPVQLLMNHGRGLNAIVLGTGFVNRARDAEAAAVEAALRATYGKEPAVLNRNNRNGETISVYRELVWRFPTTNVLFRHSLEASPETGTHDHLSVTFSRPR